MDPPPPPRARLRYGSGGSAQQGGQQFPFVVDPTEAVGAAAVRAFFPAPDGGEPPPPSSGDRAPGQERYGGHGEISLGHGQGVHHHRYHQFGVEGKQLDGGPAAAPLPRHSSSPPGFFSSPVVDNAGFPSARAGVGVGGDVHHATSSYHKKMKSPMNLAGQGTLSHISEDGIPDLTNNVYGSGHSEENITTNSVARSSNGFSIGTWEDSNSIVFSNPASNAGIHNNDDIIASLSNYELQFGATKETSGMDKYLQMQQDQVPFRVRAKRGCATHPRSIAERERRTRISEKLRKLQALVPNMDKQTSTADMLDLAVDHIRGLQSELQALKQDKEQCTCRGNHHPSGR
ncbi:transcription factor bHLH129 isoform X1 [Setaria viridis]|uniref:transcription factor bHLH129 isoform X1 n=1 Tax=Setaria viridis TaxID=4556 RepID=UPI003B3BD6AA